MDTSDVSARSADVVVVGAGPAGATSALLLARLGLDVLLLDRAAFPRSKPCGDCLSAGATALLRRLGLLDRVRAAGASRIGRWDIVAEDGTTASGRFHQNPALALDRRRLDATLVDAAEDAGARFLQARVSGPAFQQRRVTGVVCRTPDGVERRIGARLVIGADGLRSVIARRLDRVRRAPRLRKVSLTAHLPAPPVPLEHGEMHLVPHGCLGLAPAGDGLCNLTLVLKSAMAEDLGVRGPAAFFRHHVRDRLRRLRQRAPGTALASFAGLDGNGSGADLLDRIGDDELMASGPFDFPGRTPTVPGAALIGDAAGYYDPFTGQGIHHALASAELLVRAVGPVLTAARRDLHLDRALRRYARSERRVTGPTRRVQAGIEWVVARPAVASRVLARLARAPAAMDRIIEITGDTRRPASLLSPAVLSSFILPPTRRFD